MAEFSDAQVKQLLHWSAAGETPRSILAHLADETRDGVGLSPWPDASENEIEVVLHEHRTQRITLFARRLVPRVGLGGLAGRGSQAAATIDRIHVLDRQIAQCDAAFEELMRAGAFRVEPFISEERLDEVNAIYTQTFGGAVRNKDGSRAIVIARPNGERYRVETSALAVGNVLLVRAQAVSKHAAGLRMTRTKEAELLGKLTGAVAAKDLCPHRHMAHVMPVPDGPSAESK